MEIQSAAAMDCWTSDPVASLASIQSNKKKLKSSVFPAKKFPEFGFPRPAPFKNRQRKKKSLEGPIVFPAAKSETSLRAPFSFPDRKPSNIKSPEIEMKKKIKKKKTKKNKNHTKFHDTKADTEPCHVSAGDSSKPDDPTSVSDSPGTKKKSKKKKNKPPDDLEASITPTFPEEGHASLDDLSLSVGWEHGKGDNDWSSDLLFLA